jgi:hypothetical protein
MMAITDRILRALDVSIKLMFLDGNLVESVTYTRLTDRSYDEEQEHGVRGEETTVLDMIKIDDRVSSSAAGSGDVLSRRRFYAAKLEDLPAEFDANNLLEDTLTVDGSAWNILNADLVADRLCIFEVGVR